MIRKRGIIATVIYVTFLVNAIPLVSSLYDIYREPLDLDSPLVFNDGERAPNENEFESSKKEETISDSKPDENIEATEINDYAVTLASNQKVDSVDLSQKDFTIYVTTKAGKEKGALPKKISFDFYSSSEVTEENLEKMKVALTNEKKMLTQKKNDIVKKNKEGRAYVTLTLGVKNKSSVPVAIDWGDGFVITYIVKFDLEK